MPRITLSIVLLLVLVFALPAPVQAAGEGATFVSDMVQLTSGISQFFGNALNFMTQAIGYLTGGVQAADHFQQGTDIVNDMLVNGPPQQAEPAASEEPAAADAPATDDGQAATAPAAPAPVAAAGNLDSKAFRSLLNDYKDISLEERKLLEAGDAAPAEVLSDMQQVKEGNKNKILLELGQDIEEKKFEKLHILIDYLNTQGEQTTGFFLEIVDEAKLKLQFTLVQAQNMGLTMDIEVIEGKLKLIFKLTSGEAR